MNLKIPLVLDTSKWESIPNFADVQPRPVLVIPKATEGTSWVDPTFVQVFADLKQDGIARGTFHFHRKAYSPITQAQHFCNTIRLHVTKDDILVLDVEEGGETAAQLQQFITYTQAQFPDNLIMIYSRKNILDPIPMTTTQRDFFKQIPIWTAGYPLNPDAYSEPPLFYIPDRTKYGPTWLWQYGESIITGIQGECDVNWIAPVLLALLPVTTPIPPPALEHTQPFANVDEYIEIVNGERCHISVIRPDANTRFRVRHFGGALDLVSDVAHNDNAQIVFNTQDYDKSIPAPHYPQGMAYTDGMKYSDQQGAQYFLNIAQNNNTFSGFRNFTDFYNTTSFIRPLVINGDPNPDFALNPGKIEYTEIHARSALGHGSGIVVQIVAEGKVNELTGVSYRGITLPQLANLFIKYGVNFAGEHGGGGDAGKAINGVMVNEPSDPTERPVVQVMEVFITEGEPMGTIGHVKGTARSTTNIKTMSNGTLLAVMAAGDVVYGEWSTLKTDLVNFDHYYKQGARVELGELCKCVVTNLTCVEETEPGATPPPTTGNKPIIVTVDLDGYKPKSFSGELEPE